METKDEWRRRVRQEAKKHTQDERLAGSESVWRQVESLPEFQRAQVAAVYWSLPDEVFSLDFIEKWCGEKTLLLPVMQEGYALELCEYRPGGVMNKAEFGICEPEGRGVPPEQVDLIVVPGMAFDRKNQRLGRGKGYYDRLLCRMNAVKIGVCFGFQVFDGIPADEHDVRMDRVVYG